MASSSPKVVGSIHGDSIHVFIGHSNVVDGVIIIINLNVILERTPFVVVIVSSSGAIYFVRTRVILIQIRPILVSPLQQRERGIG
jgi:hypothetical protein